MNGKKEKHNVRNCASFSSQINHIIIFSVRSVIINDQQEYKFVQRVKRISTQEQNLNS